MNIKKISKSSIILIAIASILSGLFGATAATRLFNSDEVGYNNSESGIQATDVQGAIDELYAAATTYETLANRIAALEKHITSDSTSRLKEYGVELNDTTGSSTTGGYIDFHWQGSSSDYTSRISENAQGKINIQAANGVTVNGKSISTYSTKTYTNNTYGLILKAVRSGDSVTLYLLPSDKNTGITADLNTSGNYVTLFTLDEIYRPVEGFVNYSLFSATYFGQFNVYAAGGIQIGHTRKISDNTASAIPSGNSIYAVVSYTGKQI